MRSIIAVEYILLYDLQSEKSSGCDLFTLYTKYPCGSTESELEIQSLG